MCAVVGTVYLVFINSSLYSCPGVFSAIPEKSTARLMEVPFAWSWDCSSVAALESCLRKSDGLGLRLHTSPSLLFTSIPHSPPGDEKSSIQRKVVLLLNFRLRSRKPQAAANSCCTRVLQTNSHNWALAKSTARRTCQRTGQTQIHRAVSNFILWLSGGHLTLIIRLIPSLHRRLQSPPSPPQ